MATDSSPEDEKQDSFNDSSESTQTRRKRTVFSKTHKKILKDCFDKNPYPGIEEREELSRLTGIPESRIHVWFQNRRARQHIQRRKRESEATTHLRQMSLEDAYSGPILKEDFSEPEPPTLNASWHHSWTGKQESGQRPSCFFKRRNMPSTAKTSLYGEGISPSHPFFSYETMRPSTELQPCAPHRPVSQGSSSQWTSSWALQGTQGPETYKTHTSFCGGVKLPLHVQQQGWTVEQTYSKDHPLAFQGAQEPPHQLQQPQPQEKCLQQPYPQYPCPPKSYLHQPHPHQPSVLQPLAPQAPTFQVQQLTSSQHQSQNLQDQTLPPPLVLGAEQSYELSPAFNQQKLYPIDLSKKTVGLGSRCPNGYLTAPQGHLPAPQGYLADNQGHLVAALENQTDPQRQLADPLGDLADNKGHFTDPQGHLVPALENLAVPQGHLPASQRHLANTHGSLADQRDNLDDILQDLAEISNATFKNFRFQHV